MAPEQTINDLRKQIIENRANGRPADEGIDRDTLRDAVRTLRSARVLDTSKTTAGKTTRKTTKKKPTIAVGDLNNLLGI